MTELGRERAGSDFRHAHGRATGGAITGRQFDPAAAGIVIDDTGFRADTGVTLRGKYNAFHAVRAGVLGGVRRVSFQTVSGFDALVGSQDVMRGVALGLFAARGMSHFGEDDVFLSSTMYAGAASGNALLATLAQVEGRHDPSGGSWNSIIGSTRTTLYWGSAPGVVLVVSDELSGGSHSRLPLQVTFGDRDGGLRGYYYSALAGERRNITRAELRWSAASLVRRADFGFAAFSEVGTLWAGDAPYGVNATRASVGVSLLAAYPTREKYPPERGTRAPPPGGTGRAKAGQKGGPDPDRPGSLRRRRVRGRGGERGGGWPRLPLAGGLSGIIVKRSGGRRAGGPPHRPTAPA